MSFSKELSMGNRIIDATHKKLNSRINEISYLIAARDAAGLSEAFELLENCLLAYFAIEENIARAVNFDFVKHRLDHENLLSKCQQIKDALLAENGAGLEIKGKHYVDLLKNYLIRHIKDDEAKSFSYVLHTHFYNFDANPESSM